MKIIRFIPIFLKLIAIHFFVFSLFLLITPISEVQALSSSVTYSNDLNPNQPIQMRHMITTTDGTIHHFIQVKDYSVTCDGSAKSGLLWFTSTDGNTWTCEGQLSADTSIQFYASAATDVSNNIYVTYSSIGTGASSSYDIYFRKLTKGGGSTWTLEAEQKVLDADATIGYQMSDVQVEDSTRLWLTARYYNGTNYRVQVYYSNNQTSSPTWSQAFDTFDAADTYNTLHISSILDYGSKIVIVYNYYYSLGNGTYMRMYTKGDSPTSWSSPWYVGSSSPFYAITDDDGYIYVMNYSSSGPVIIALNERGRIGGSLQVIIPLLQNQNTPYSASLSTDGKNVWISMLDTTSTVFYRYVPGKGAIRVGQLGMPMESMSSYFLTNPETSQGIFNKYWYYDGSTYLDDTTDAGDIGTGDTAGGKNVGNIGYFGKLEKFEGVSWNIANPGTGGTVAWEYWNGTTWASLTFKNSQNANFSNTTSGYISFQAPGDWATTTVGLDVDSYYYVRYRILTLFSGTINGAQYVSNPPIYGIVSPPRILNNKLYVSWSEGTVSSTEVRSNSVSVDTTEPSESTYTEIYPHVMEYIDGYDWTGLSSQRELVETSDGTIHWFVQAGAYKPIVCDGQELSGVFWYISTDGGETWVCQERIYSSIYDMLSAVVDSNDNIYVVIEGGYSIIYIKLTKGVGSTWLVSSPQNAITVSDPDYLFFPTIEVDDNERLWVSLMYEWDDPGSYDYTYEVQIYYSSDLSNTPTWTLSMEDVSTPSTEYYQISDLFRFGTDKTGIIYSDSDKHLYFRFRNDTDELTSWSSPTQISVDTVEGFEQGASTTTDGKIFVSWLDYNTYAVYFSWYNGTSWSTPIQISDEDRSTVQLMTDGSDVYIVTQYEERNLPIIFIGEYPYTADNFSEVITPDLLYKRDLDFDKVWVYASGMWTNETTDAASDTISDVTTVTSQGDTIYVGSTEKFDSVRWARSTISTAGVGFWEYWNGSQWVKIKAMSNIFNVTLTNNGYFGFIPYDNWAKTSLNGEEETYYYIRVRVVTSFTVGLTLDTIWPSLSVGYRVPEYITDSKVNMLIFERGYGADKIRFTSYSLVPVETVSITNLDTELSAIDVLTNLDVTVPSTLFKGADRQVKIFDGVGVSKKLLAQVTVDLSTSQSWSGVGGDVDVVNKKSVTRGLSTAPGVSSQWKLYVPKGNGDNRIRVCLTASVLADISTLCSPGVTLTDEDPTVSTVVSEGETYWEISDTAVAGAVSYNEPAEEIIDEEEEEENDEDDDIIPPIQDEEEEPEEDIPPVEEEIEEEEEEIPVVEPIVDKGDNDSGAEIAAASTVAVIVGSLIIVISLFFLQITSTGNSLYIHLFQLLSSLFGIGPLRDKNQSYGIVYDSVSKEPLSRAIVRVLDSAGKLITTVVTDIYGIFDIVLKTGRYKFTVDVNMYRFPSLVIKTDRDEPYENIYRGSLINHSMQEILNLSVPVDKVDRELLAESGATFKNVFKGIWNLLSILIFVLGFSTTIYSLINDPNIYIWILFVIYILFILLYAYLYIQSLRGYGTVRDIHGDILSGIEVGIYEQEFGTLYAKRITDEKGRYRFIVPQGEYKLSILTSNYKVVDLGRELFEVKEGKIRIIKERMRVS